MAAPRIYVIDYDPAVRDVLQELLEEEGYQVSVDQPDMALLERVRAASPALVMVDVHSVDPKLGWTLLNQLRSDPMTCTLPVLVTTTDHRWRAANEAALASRGLAVLDKPFELKVVLDTLAGLLGERAKHTQR